LENVCPVEALSGWREVDLFEGCHLTDDSPRF
jgi:hypothetical protein